MNAAAYTPQWLESVFPGGRWQANGEFLCSIRDEKKPSCLINLEKRTFHDFGGSSGRLSELCSTLGITDPYRKGEGAGAQAPAPAPDKNPEVLKLWNSAKPAGEHPYLGRKDISGEGCRVAGGLLLVPAHDMTGAVVGIERISADGKKKHLGSKGFFILGELEPDKPLLLAEGFATAVSLKEISGFNAACVFGEANFSKAVKALREIFSGEIRVAPDAQSTAKVEDAGVVSMPDGYSKNTDWNDLLLDRGAGVTKDLFQEAWEKAQAEPKKPAKETLHPVTAKDLRHAIIRQPVWSVEQLVPEGLSVLASPPKTGKSFLVLQMALAVATGEPFLQHRTKQGAVLYAALEDSLSRLSKRISLLVEDDRDVPENLHLLTELPRLDEGGLSTLGEWIASNHPRLVIVDTWAKVKPTGDGRKNAYEKDVDIVSEVKKLADQHGCSILLVHHEKKGGGKEADWLESLSGSMGLTATVDGILSLKRNRGERQGVLRRSGRDLEDDGDIGLLWKEPGWEYQGDAVKILISEERMRILQSIREAGEPVAPAYVAADIGKNSNTTRGLLMKMVRDGTLSRTPSGRYTLPQEKKIIEKNDDDDVNGVNSVNAVNSVNSRGVYGPEGGVNSTVNAINASDTKGLDDSVYAVYAVYGEGKNSGALSGESVSSLAERAGVPLEAVREELERWQEAGRVALGEDGSVLLLAGTAFPGQGEPEEPEVPDEEPGAAVDEPADTPSLAWLKEQSEEVKEKYAEELRRVTIVGAAADPEARALELVWASVQSIKEG